jgi:hypothetical protein
VSLSHSFDGADLDQLEARGIAPEEAERQLRYLREPPQMAGPVRPCTIGDGILRLAEEDSPRLLAAWQTAVEADRLTKMVPASGAATRMFRVLRTYLESGAADRAELERRAEGGEAEAREQLRLFDSLPDLALYHPLLEHVGEGALRDLPTIARALLGGDGLELDRLPKALIPFHDYPDGPRNAFEEHFVEAASYLTTAGGVARLHFTAPVEARQRFEEEFAGFRGRLEARFGIRFELTTSVQDPATDTLAADLENRPFRLEDGRLLFRPAGHGALLGNLERLGGDIVLLKNIDNVPPERLQEPTSRWKRLLVGVLVEIEEGLANLERSLAEGEDRVEEGIEALRSWVAIEPPPEIVAAGGAVRRAWLAERLARPLRVCGMVAASGEPGGGPFWVPGADGGLYGQIVEASQIDLQKPVQAAAWKAATHFNPVDVVCKLRDSHGRPFPLASFVDPTTAFISRKSHGSRPLQALERPGLWNGSMAGWNTVFVEVPAETFNPVKTVLDLLRPAHRA